MTMINRMSGHTCNYGRGPVSGRKTRDCSRCELDAAKELRDGLTAEQHIQRAEELLAGRLGGDSVSEWWDPPTEYGVALAQVHATLAQARAAIDARAEVTVTEPRIRPAVPR